MIIRPLKPRQQESSTPRPIWPAIEATQKQRMNECWLITQPAHAALSADMAAKLEPAAFPGITEEVLRGIALHDAGWSLFDARAIQESRAGGVKASVQSFLLQSPGRILEAWRGSIDTAQKVGPLAGLLVSRHFVAIGKANVGNAGPQLAAAGEKFAGEEQQRQSRLRKKITLSDGQIARLLEALQFCDLLSLYICSGVQEAVTFPQQVNGAAMVLTSRSEGSCRLAPNPFASEQTFSVSALRHPKAGTGDNSLLISLRVT